MASESWLAVVQDADGNEDTEVVTINFLAGRGGWNIDAGTTLELTNGQRITLIEPAGERAA